MGNKTNFKHGMGAVELFIDKIARDKPQISDWDKELLAALIEKIMHGAFEHAVFETANPKNTPVV